MLLVPSSILDLYDLIAPSRNLCANPLRVGTMQFTPFNVLLLLERVLKSGYRSAADNIFPHTATSPPQTGLGGGGWEDAVSVQRGSKG